MMKYLAAAIMLAALALLSATVARADCSSGFCTAPYVVSSAPATAKGPESGCGHRKPLRSVLGAFRGILRRGVERSRERRACRRGW